MDLIGSYDDSSNSEDLPESENSQKLDTVSVSISVSDPCTSSRCSASDLPPEYTAGYQHSSSVLMRSVDSSHNIIDEPVTSVQNKLLCSHNNTNNINYCQLCMEKPSRSIKDKSEPLKLDFFALETVSDSSDNDLDVGHKTESMFSHSDTKELHELPSTRSEFWDGNDGEINWHKDQHVLWKCKTAVNSAQIDIETQRNHNYKGYTAKHARISPQHTQSNDIQQEGDNNKKLDKSCYKIHPKIAPRLHANTAISKPPRTKLQDFEGHSGAINRIQWCIPSYSHLLLSGSMDKTVKVWNAFSSVKYCVQTLCHHDKAVKDAKWSPSGLQILSCGYDKASCLVDVEKGTCVSKWKENNFVTCVNYHPVNHNLFVSGSMNSIKAWDCRIEARPIRTFHYKDTFGQVQDMEFVGNGRELFSCNDLVTRDSSDRNVMAWDFDTGIVLSNQMYQERFTCCHLRVLNNEATLLAQSHGNYIAQFSTIKPYKMNKCKRYEAHKVESYSVGFDISPDNRLIISGSADGKLPIYDFRTTRVIEKLHLGQNQVCLDVAWHPLLPSYVAAGTWDGQLSIWS